MTDAHENSVILCGGNKADEIPPPMTEADCDLRDFQFMPLLVSRLRRSKAWLMAKKQPALGFYMVNLWTASWHEVPAASLEDDDDVLADLAMCDLKTWAKVKAQALHGWVKCSDGRLYHSVIAEQATASWQSRKGYRERLSKARDAKKQRQSKNENASITEHVTGDMTGSIIDADTGPDIALKGQGQGQGQGQGERKNPPTPQGASGGGLFDCEGVERWEVSKRDNKSHPVVAEHYLDMVWDLVVDAAQINEQTWRSNLAPLIGWLKAGVEPEDICAVIRRMVRADPTFRPFSLKPFDAAVMAHAKQAAA